MKQEQERSERLFLNVLPEKIAPITQTTYKLLKDEFVCETSESIEVKGEGAYEYVVSSE